MQIYEFNANYANMRIDKLKKVHCVGIGGIHVSALAKLFLARGVEVSGSDLVESEITKELQKSNPNLRMHPNATNLKDAINVLSGVDLVIYSDAVPEADFQRMAAKELGIGQMSSYDFIGELSKDYYTIAVSGTNGKSTTTAMLGLILEAAGLDPTVIVGTKVRPRLQGGRGKEWDGNIRIGREPEQSSVHGKKYLVTEADEYKAHMLKLHPKMIVLTNIEEDHLDFYKDLDDIVEYFKEYVGKLAGGGVLVYNEDDGRIVKLLNCYIARKVGYSIEDVSSLKLSVPGDFNKYNAAGAAVAARELGVSDEVIKKSLEDFKGTWRRFEKVGECKGATVISDYAHHPTSVFETIKATKELYPDRRLVVVFQPHQHNRTRMLFDEFVEALAKSDADILILSEVYDVAGRTRDEDKRVSSKDLVEKVKSQKSKVKNQSPKSKVESKVRNILYGGNLEETRTLMLGSIKAGDVVLVMGAGSIDEVAREIVSEKLKI